MPNIVPCDAYEIPENSRLYSIELVIVCQEWYILQPQRYPKQRMNADTLIGSRLPLQFQGFIAVPDRITGRY